MVITRSMTKNMQKQQENEQIPIENTQKKQTHQTQPLYKEKKWKKPTGWMWGRWMFVANGARW